MLKKKYTTPYAEIQPKIRKPYTEILFIRHCHPDYKVEKKTGDRDMPLSKDGLKQRGYLTSRLLKARIDKVYSSELKRAKQTAEIFVKKKKKELNIDPRLNEFHWAHWYKMKYFNMTEIEREKRLRHHKMLDRELDKMQTEARRAVAEIYKNNKGKKVAVFSHGNFIKSLLTGVLNADIIGFLSLEIFQSSISKIIIDKNGYIKIVYINSVDHLPHPPAKDMFVTLLDYENK
ncbi:MAG TPA: histidine phosphatase family protein [Patescibacteria group bacterium]|nr:histidine phosphatase family protein [Patescibacteria group bacterium]